MKLILEAGQINRHSPPDTESYRSRSPPINDRDRDLQIPPLNFASNSAYSPNTLQDDERRHDFNGTYLTPTPRGQLPEGEEELSRRPHDSVLHADSPLTPNRDSNPVTNTPRPSAHEMPVPSPSPKVVSPYRPTSLIDTRVGC